MNKTDQYAALVQTLAPLWQTDVLLQETNLDAWHLAWVIDEWLFTYRDHTGVSEAQYARNCQRLLDIYRPALDAREWEEVV